MKKNISMFLLLIAAFSGFANVQMPPSSKSGDNSTDIRIGDCTVRPTGIILSVKNSKSLADALVVGQKISPEWPEIIIAASIISESISANSNIGFTYNNYSFQIYPADQSPVRFFPVERMSDPVKLDSKKPINLPTGTVAEKLRSIGAEITQKQDSDGEIYLIVYSVPYSAGAEYFCSGIDNVLHQLFPNWKTGARQFVAAVSGNISDVVLIPFNGVYICIFPKSVIFGKEKNQFIIGIKTENPVK